MAPAETLTPRERVSLALNHEEPDRIPIDLGGFQTGIHRVAYQDLIAHLGLEEEPPALLYVPLSQMAERFSKLSVQLLPLNLIVKSGIESAGLVPAVEKAVWSYDPDQPVTGATSMEQVVANPSARRSSA